MASYVTGDELAASISSDLWAAIDDGSLAVLLPPLPSIISALIYSHILSPPFCSHSFSYLLSGCLNSLLHDFFFKKEGRSDSLTFL